MRIKLRSFLGARWAHRDESGRGRGVWLVAVLVAVVLIVGASYTWVAAGGQARRQQQLRAEMMDRRTHAVTEAVQAQVRRYTDTLWDLSAAASAQTSMTAEAFATMTSRVTAEQLPGATGVFYVVPATDDQLGAVQSHWRRAGGAPSLQLEPVGHGREHLMRVLSTVTGDAGMGPDVSASDEATEALVLARNHRQITASRTYVLLRDRGLSVQEQQLSFILAAPVFAGPGAHSAGQFEGWIVMGLRGRDFITQTLRQTSQDLLDVSLADASTPQSAGMLVAHAGTLPAAADQALNRRATIPVAGRSWQLLMRPTTSMLASTGPGWLVRATALLGAVLTLLLAALVASLAYSWVRALRMVDHATTELHRDISRRELVETQLRQHEAELEAFAGVVAHDLKSPLTGITGYTEILQETYAPGMDDMGRRCLDKISGGAARMRALIDDLLAYAAAGDNALHYAEVDVRAMVQDILTERCDALAEPPAVHLGPLPTLRGDPVLLRQVLDNLIGNSLKYVRPGTVAHLNITAAPTDHGWRIDVSDHGIGIATEDQDSVFDAFRRARGSEGYTGTGLGLAICKRIIDRHHGHISVKANLDNPAGGTTFTFTLPHAEPAAGTEISTGNQQTQERIDSHRSPA